MQQPSGRVREHTGRSPAVRPTTRSAEGKSTRSPASTDGLRIAVSAVGATSTIGPEGEWDLAGKPPRPRP
jgi:hypothetical protein